MSTSSTRARPGGSGESTPQQPNSQNKRAQGPSHQHPYPQPEVYGPWAPQQPPMLSPYQNAPQYNQWAPQQPPMPSLYQNAQRYNLKQWAPQQPLMPSSHFSSPPPPLAPLPLPTGKMIGVVCPYCKTTFAGVPALKVHMANCLGVPPPPSHPGTSAPHFQQEVCSICEF